MTTKDKGPFPGVSIPEMKHFRLALVDAFILARVRYLAPKSTISRNGHRWTVWSLDKWAQKLVVSRSTVGRAIRKLTHLKLVASEVHLLGGKTRTFLRPLRVTQCQIDKAQNQSASSGSTKTRSRGTAGMGRMANPSMSDERSQRMREEPSFESDLGFSDFFEEEEEEEEETEEVAAKEGDDFGDATDELSQEEMLEDAWRRAWSQCIGTFCPAWNRRDRAEALEIIAVCAEADLDPALAVTLIIIKWDDFTEYANSRAGAYPMPNEPTLQWISKWRGPFARFCLEMREILDGTSDAPDGLVADSPTTAADD